MRVLTLSLLVMTACHASSAGPIAWSPPIEVAAGGGERGPWQQNDSRFDHVDDPSIVFAADGTAIVAWVDHRPKDVLVQVFDARGAPRGAPVNVSRTPAVFSWLPRLAVSPGHPRDVYILWQEIVFSGGSHGGDILFARSEDGGASFGPAHNLSRSLGGDGKARLDRTTWQNGSLDLVAGPDGALYAAWTEYDGPLWFARSTDRGATFSPARTIVADPARPARAPALAATRDALYLAWSTGEDRSADIQLARSLDGGATFDEPTRVATTPAFSDAPKLAVDARGALHLAYADGEHIRYTRSPDGRSFMPPRLVSGDDIAGFPALALDGPDVYLSWERYPTRGQPPRGLGYAVSRDAGTTFSAPREVPASADPSGGGNGSFQGRLMRKLAVHDGTVAVVNSSLALGRGSRVWLVFGARRG